MLRGVITRDLLLLVQAIEERPALRGILEDALRLEGEHAGDEVWGGFNTNQVHASSAIAKQLILLRVFNEGYSSRSTVEYRLADPEGVRRALEMADADRVPEPEDGEIPPDLFEIVEGHERAKEVLWAAVRASRPVHVLLVGPPASAKSLFLAELERLPGSRRVLGSTTTRAGIVSYLLAERGCRWLLIDEIDKADGRDLTALYGLMSEERVERLQHRHQEQERRPVWVFASANDAERLQAALLSRFAVLRIRPYESEAEFRRVAEAVLVRREGADPELAAEIAARVASRSRSHDVRDAVKIHRLCRGDRRRVEGFVEELLASA